MLYIRTKLRPPEMQELSFNTLRFGVFSHSTVLGVAQPFGPFNPCPLLCTRFPVPCVSLIIGLRFFSWVVSFLLMRMPQTKFQTKTFLRKLSPQAYQHELIMNGQQVTVKGNRRKGFLTVGHYPYRFVELSRSFPFPIATSLAKRFYFLGKRI